MKKKSRLLLLALLPLLACCTVDEGTTNFKIKEFDDSDVLEFNLEDGLDLTAPFGLYNKNNIFADRHFDNHFMFLAMNDKEGASYSVWTRFYDITDRYEDCFWEHKKGKDYYSKQANLHLDSRFFDPQCDMLAIILAGTSEYDPDENRYATYELNYYSYTAILFYSVYKNQTVTVSPYRNRIPKITTRQSTTSSDSQTSSSEKYTLATEESIESSEAEI